MEQARQKNLTKFQESPGNFLFGGKVGLIPAGLYATEPESRIRLTEASLMKRAEVQFSSQKEKLACH